jgi:hypothetical protein
MHKRHTQSQTEVDFLPPFGKPEVVTTGDDAVDVALGATVVGGAVYLLNN